MCGPRLQDQHGLVGRELNDKNMTLAIGLIAAGIFAGLAIVHVILAVACSPGSMTATLPHIGDRPAFVPSKTGTLAVAFALGGCALLILGRLGLLGSAAPDWLYRWGTLLLAVLLALRAIGDFRLVGFFKRIRSSTFARLDSWLYSPLCVLLAAACAIVALSPVA